MPAHTVKISGKTIVTTTNAREAHSEYLRHAKTGRDATVDRDGYLVASREARDFYGVLCSGPWKMARRAYFADLAASPAA